MNAYLGEEASAGKAILRDLVNATIGFEELASVLKKPSKSLHCMLAPHGNPSTAMICSSVCRFRVMGLLLPAHHSTSQLPSQWCSFRGEGHSRQSVESRPGLCS